MTNHFTPYQLAMAAERAYHDPVTLSIAGVEVHITQDGEHFLFSFRGTTKDGLDIFTDLRFLPWYSAKLGWVHAGFWKGVRKMWPKIVAYIEDRKIDPAKCHYDGHSKGGGEATHAAALHKLRWGVIGSLTTFGKPRCGRSLERFFDVFEVRRFVIEGDPVPNVPAAIIFFRHEFWPIQIGDPDHDPGIWELELHRILFYAEQSRNVT